MPGKKQVEEPVVETPVIPIPVQGPDMSAFNKMHLEYRDPRTLQPYEGNPKTHPTEQREDLGEFLDEVGWVGTLLVNDQTGHLLDGHMRQDEAVERNLPYVPVLVISVPEDKEPEIIALYDTVGRLYRIDRNALNHLREMSDIKSENLKALLDKVKPSGEAAEENEVIQPDAAAVTTLPPGGISMVMGEQYNYLVLMFHTGFDFTVACDHFGVERQRCAFHQTQVGMGRVVDGTKYLNWVIREGKLRKMEKEVAPLVEQPTIPSSKEVPVVQAKESKNADAPEG